MQQVASGTTIGYKMINVSKFYLEKLPVPLTAWISTYQKHSRKLVAKNNYFPLIYTHLVPILLVKKSNLEKSHFRVVLNELADTLHITSLTY